MITEKQVEELEQGCGKYVSKSSGLFCGGKISRDFCFKCKQKAKKMIKKLGCKKNTWFDFRKRDYPCGELIGFPDDYLLCGNCQKLKERLEAIS